MDIKIGDVFFNDLHKSDVLGIPAEKFHFYYRILFCDKNYFISDLWDDELGEGNINKYGKRFQIYGKSPLSLLKKCKYIRNVPLTEEEEKIIFANKPINLLPELNEFFWTSEKIATEEDLLQTLNGGDKKLLLDFPKIELSSFILFPFNSRNGFGKAVKLEANNRVFFSPVELLLKIYDEQSQYIKTKQIIPYHGVSRVGHQKDLPCYSVRKG